MRPSVRTMGDVKPFCECLWDVNAMAGLLFWKKKRLEV